MRSRLEKLRDHSAILLTLNYLRGQMLSRVGRRGHLSGATLRKYSIDEGVEYIERVFSDYMLHADLPQSAIRGARVLEVGPGDNLGVALLFAAHGADHVACIDAFSPVRDENKARAIYRRLSERLRERGIHASADPATARVRLYQNTPIEQALRLWPAGSFDLIVSRAVLEHVGDVGQAWRCMDTLLAPGGVQLHKIDFRNHDFYSSLHPLYFLRLPEQLWRLVSAPDPTLNRCRAGTYEQLAIASGCRFQMSVTHLVGRDRELPPLSLYWPPPDGTLTAEEQEMVACYRQKLSSPFNSMSAAELLVDGVFLVAKKAADDRVGAS